MAPQQFISGGTRRALLVLLCSGCLAASARPHSNSAFERAERQREALEGRPQQQRTRAAYEHVLDAFRAIYQNNPKGEEADAAVDAVAGLLAEEGRSFHNVALLHAAIEQYDYLRRTYPSSNFRQSALLSKAEIAQSDLQDDAAARQAFTEFLRLYPSSPLAGEARQQLKAMRASAPVEAALPSSPLTKSEAAQQAARNAAEHARELAELNATRSPVSRSPPRTPAPPPPVSPVSEPANAKSAPASPAPASSAPATTAILITGVRHWSTPIYTRVAIDLSDQVHYEAARVPDPDRIYFDLHGARLAPELVGKSFDVTDDGFLRRIRIAQSSKGSSRVVLDVSHVSEYSAFFLPNPWRLIIDIHASAANGSVLYGGGTPPRSGAASVAIVPTAPPQTTAAPAKPATPQDEVAGLAQQPRRVRATTHATTGPIAASVSGTTRAQQPNELEALATPPALSATAPAATPPAVTPPPARTRRNATPAPANPIAETPALTAHEAAPASTGERSLVRALGLKIGRIVIDAGHGGHDSGTLSADGLEEKDVVLDVSLRLGKLLKQRLGADVIYTRDDDTFIPLETRTAIANKAQADLFISVHANSSSDPSARGVEVYYLNFTTSPEALEVAARENAVSDQSIYQLSDLVKKITLKDKIDESHEFASNVESSLFTGLVPGNEGLKDRGVKKAPFVVLIGANMPSILAEISFLTNPEDARELRDPNYRERIAESLYRGVSRYVSGLSGVRLAQTGGRTGASGRN